METRTRSGAVILEPLVALVVVMIAGLTLLTSLRELRDASSAYRARNEAMLDASAFLDRVALWPATELDLRLGERRQGRYILRVTRMQVNLYELALLDSETRALILWTAVARPVAAEDPNAQ